jgi:hypothetical protein
MPFTCHKCKICPHSRQQRLCPECDPSARTSAPEKRKKGSMFKLGPGTQFGTTYSLTWEYSAESRKMEIA